MSVEYGPSAFQRDLDVSRETLARLEKYAELLQKWQAKINLVSRGSLKDLWRRHFLDSAQLAPVIQKVGGASPRCLDIGAGAGFPGMVLAIQNVGEWTLVESDQRKTAFLAELSRSAEVSVTLRGERIETMEAFAVDVITARAVAPLERLLTYAKPFVAEQTICLFPKGQRYAQEIDEARDRWDVEVEALPSLSDADGRILLIRGLFHER